MTTQIIPDMAAPASPAAAPAAPTPMESLELNWLKAAGEDVGDLQVELEGFLQGNRNVIETGQPDPVDTSPREPDYRLGIDKDGQAVEVAPRQQPAQQAQQQPQPQQTQEQALDPLRPDGADAAPATQEYEPGEVVLGEDSRPRDPATGRYVPLNALHQERLRLKEARAEVEKFKESNARAQERLNVLTEIIHGQQQATQPAAQQPEAEAAPAIPDPEVDIFAAVKQLIQLNNANQTRLKEVQENADRRIDHIQKLDRYQRDALAFSTQNPDFFDAYRYLNQHRKNELTILGFPEAQIDKQLVAEEETIRNIAFGRQNGSPSQLIYDMAKARGYAKKEAPKPQQPSPAPQSVAQPAPNQAQPTQQPVAAPQTLQVAPDAAQAVQRIAAGQQAAATLTGAGGSGTEGMTVQQLADMSEDDFVAFATKFGPKKLDRLLRG